VVSEEFRALRRLDLAQWQVLELHQGIEFDHGVMLGRELPFSPTFSIG
jgi:hypothetical protein